MKIFSLFVKFTLFLFILASLNSYAQIKLPALISDGMVLQRDINLKIWGSASVGEKVTVVFNGSVYETIANESGFWIVTTEKQKAGGPFEMIIKGKNELKIKNILIGDVWLCSGQSNMELPMRRVAPIYGSEIANATNNFIRYFAVPQKYNFKNPQQNFEKGSWQECNPKSVMGFGAVSYFFAKDLNDKYKIPIGIINASLGGSPAEAWISEEAIKPFADYYNECQRFKSDSLIKAIEAADNASASAWYGELQSKDLGYKSSSWKNSNLKTKDWETMKIPGYWADTKLGQKNGVVWFRKEISLNKNMTGKPAMIIMGRIVDADSIFINGVFVGTTSYQYPPRRYEIPVGVLKAGKNTVVVRVISNSGKGGFVPDKDYQIVCDGKTVDISGDWQFKLGAEMPPMAGSTFVRWKPVGLYNAMIAPLLNYAIKGAAWYQGESNTSKPNEYTQLLSTLIKDWRYRWQQGDFPFLVIQLPNFMEVNTQPETSDWAMMRESQAKILALPNTGLVVTIDLGEWNDIHPLNKKDVANRLSLTAQSIAYNDTKNGAISPIYNSMVIDGNKIELTFDNIENGIIAKDGTDLKYFTIAGADKKFVWAKAKIEGNKVIVWHENIPNPTAVRYAWANNPHGANMFNNKGLPVSPFRTDNFDK